MTAVVQPMKTAHALQRIDDCRPFNDKNRYTTTSRDGWLQLEWLNKCTLKITNRIANNLTICQ